MRTTRTLVAPLIALAMLVASPAMAQQVYSMYGRLISTRGEFIKIPVIGQNQGNCNNFDTGLDPPDRHGRGYGKCGESSHGYWRHAAEDGRRDSPAQGSDPNAVGRSAASR